MISFLLLSLLVLLAPVSYAVLSIILWLIVRNLLSSNAILLLAAFCLVSFSCRLALPLPLLLLALPPLFVNLPWAIPAPQPGRVSLTGRVSVPGRVTTQTLLLLMAPMYPIPLTMNLPSLLLHLLWIFSKPAGGFPSLLW
jgi:hypothetical protein